MPELFKTHGENWKKTGVFHAPVMFEREKERIRTKLYKSSAWRRLRHWWITNHPLCEKCKAEGRLVKATDVDHIIPHKGNRHLFFDSNNLQSLCRSCHSLKTASEDGGFGNRIVKNG